MSIKKSYPSVAVTPSFTEMLAGPVDAVSIATPPSTHFELAKAALMAGKHVLVEKPLTTTFEDAEKLVELAERQGLVLMVGHTYEYNAAVEFLRDMVVSGELGDIYTVDSARLNLGLFQRDCDVVWDLAPHDLSMINYVLGAQPVTVSARGAAHINPERIEVAHLELEYPGNVLAHVHVSWLDPSKVRRLTVVGSRRMVIFDDMSDSDRIRVYDKGVSLPTDGQDPRYAPVHYRYGDVHVPYIQMKEPLAAECKHYVDSIVNGTTPRSSGAVGARVVRMLESASRSMANNGQPEMISIAQRSTVAAKKFQRTLV
jgi:predicted dehydrogenase